ncbi:hypothetical protein B7P43_G11593 [Cryptotermes secundus]|uniref:Uncharacterized protein n=1 Tax=Cryptotermes secundus TaxID=105785 RepID=A0A2J7QVV3_9NEOP|nr:hypothetical protein B7P43_G11593 [Cryptotermes secundus]
MWLVGSSLRRSQRRGTLNTGVATPGMRQSQIFTQRPWDKPSMDLLAKVMMRTHTFLKYRNKKTVAESV